MHPHEAAYRAKVMFAFWFGSQHIPNMSRKASTRYDTNISRRAETYCTRRVLRVLCETKPHPEGLEGCMHSCLAFSHSE